MEPLSAAASIIAVVELSSKVARYITTAVGATKERKRLREEVRACQRILQQLKDESDDSEEGVAWSETIRVLQAPSAPLEQLVTALTAVEAKLEPRRGLERAWVQLKWPFKEKEVDQIIAIIERQKNLLGLALANNSRKLIQSIKRNAQENGRQLTELIENMKQTSRDNLSQLTELRVSLEGVERSQVQLQERLDGLHSDQVAQQDLRECKDILDWLSPVDYALQQNDFFHRRQPGTGQWLLQSTEYQDWLKTSNLALYCPGIPGAGKTILTAIVINDLIMRFHNFAHVAIAFIYCDSQRRDEQGAIYLLANILKQLCQGLSSLPDHLKTLHDRCRRKRTRPPFEEILKALQSVVSMFSRVFIVIDALDECQKFDGSQKTLLTEIFNLRDKTGMSILVTSRDLSEIEWKLKGSRILKISAEEEDIERYVDGQMFRLPDFVARSPQLQEEIKAGIVNSVHGMFLLAQLHLNSLVGKRSVKAVRIAISSFPSGLEAIYDAYNDLMERIEDQSKDQQELAKQVLIWIVRAKRPLTALELQHALAVEFGTSGLDEDNVPQIEDMVSVCAGLVTVDKETSIIRLVHPTAQEYFERTQKRWFADAEAQAYITTICLTYLAFDTFGSGTCATFKDFEERLRANPFYNYAANNWGHHAYDAPIMLDRVLDFLMTGLHVQASTQVLMELGRYDIQGPTGVTALHLASYFGLHETAKCLLVSHHKACNKDTSGRTYLPWTAENGHFAQLLEISKTHPDSKDKLGRTPLSWAVNNGHEPIVELLLDSGCSADLEDEQGRTPLSFAAEKGHNSIVKRLLATDGIDVNSRHVFWPKAVFYGLWIDDEESMKIWFPMDDDPRLSFAGSNLSSANTDYGLMEKMFDALNKSSRDEIEAIKSGQTPILLTTQTVFNKMELVLARDSTVAAGRTPLHLAALNGHAVVVKTLLEVEDIVTDPVDESNKTPLSYAAAAGHETVVRLLLSADGVNPNSMDGDYQTPLSLAVKYGHEAVIKLLLDKGGGEWEDSGLDQSGQRDILQKDSRDNTA